MSPLVELAAVGDARGRLVALEAGRQVPFDIRRVYYLTGLSPDQPRGFHAHWHLRQFAVCVAGSCRFVMEDAEGRAEFRLSSATQAILIEPLVWHEMHDFSPDCVLMVLASGVYDEADYIRSYDAFRKAVRS